MAARRRELIKVEFLIPLTEDKSLGNGRKHGPFRWKALQDTMETHFGGWTRAGDRQGAWIEPKTRRRVPDKSRAFEVDVREDQLNLLRELLRRACQTFVQHVSGPSSSDGSNT